MRTRKSWRRSLLTSATVGIVCGCHLMDKHMPPPPPVDYPPPAVVCPPADKPLPVPEKPDHPDDARLGEPQPIDLATALKLADKQNPEIAVVRTRILEALAVQEKAEVLCLPNVELGWTYMRHDGQIQNARGDVFGTSRQSLFAGAVGNGVSLFYDTAEAYFAPLVAKQVVAARQAGAAATTNNRMLDVAVAYIDLLAVYAELQINEETLRHARRLLEITENFEKAGKGAAADTARSRTEVRMREREQLDIQGRIGLVSARLNELLLLPPECSLRPLEPALVPIAVIPEQAPLKELVVQALGQRPELAENRELIGAALDRWRAAKMAPFIPNLRLAYAAGAFGGGMNSSLGQFDGRHDLAATVVWEVDNLGFGNKAEIKQRYARYSEGSLRQVALQAQVAREVVQAFQVAYARRREMATAQEAVIAARVSYEKNEERVRRAPEQGRPIELLQAIQAMNRARLDYLQVVADYNRAQFRLYTALGNPPLCALDATAQVPVTEPTAPAPPAAGAHEELPRPKPQ